ncbi:hypothetical protein SAMN05444157_1292 [Frankineae bacterium MT45]|nr:hypothetical protein SAMN05444157_1292 [Frankineae bacterium MT45]
MLSLLLYGLLAVVAVGVLFLIAVFLLPAGTRIAPAATDQALPQQLPMSLLSGPDIAAVRLPVALRGYRFAETDRLLDRLSGELALRDAELARLRAELGLDPATDAEPEPPTATPDPSAAIPERPAATPDPLVAAPAPDSLVEVEAAPPVDE